MNEEWVNVFVRLTNRLCLEIWFFINNFFAQLVSKGNTIMETENKFIAPGSDEAIEQGCTCPVLDNHHGAGTPKGLFWISAGCPIHAEAAQEKHEVERDSE